MNRLASAFSHTSVQSSGSEPSQPRSSPVEAIPTSHPDAHGTRRPSVGPPPIFYDDPRGTHFPDLSSPSVSPGTLTSSILTARRPTLLRTHTEGPRSGSATPRALSRIRQPDISRAVKCNIFVEPPDSRRSWGMNPVPGSSRVTAMAQGPDDKYVVAGGTYLRVLQFRAPRSGASTPVPDDKGPSATAKGPGGVEIVEVSNLWRGQWGAIKGISDLSWGVGQFQTKVAGACSGGNILIFDTVKGRLDREIGGGHTRPIKCLRMCQTPSHSHQLLTGGTEGSAKIWDLRESTHAMRKFFKHSVPITSVSFCPDIPHQFIVGLDNGSMQRYDIRNHLKAIGRIWGAHANKPVVDLQWKTGDEGGWLASAGQDRTVQIWDMGPSHWNGIQTPTHVLHTGYPLRRVQWRPGHETELAIVPHLSSTTSADPSAPQRENHQHHYQLDDDAHIEVWDVRRHNVAKYAIAADEGPAVGVHWADDDTIVSAFQSGVFAQLDIRNQNALPLDSIPRNGMSWNARGEMAYALDRFKPGEIPFDDVKPEYSGAWDKVGRKQKNIRDEAYEPEQAVGVMPPFENDAEDFFEYLAQRYKVEGAPPDELCWTNSEVAEYCGRHDDARMWNFLRLVIEELAPKSSTKSPATPFEDPTTVSHPPSIRQKFDEPFALSPTRGLIRQGASPKPKPIQLERLGDSLADVEDDALSLSGSFESGSSASASDSEESEEIAPTTRSRFLSFAPPDIRRLSESRTATTRSSVATVVPTHPPPSSNNSNNNNNTSNRVTPRTLFAHAVGVQMMPRTQTMSTISSHSTSSNNVSRDDSDVPDPYGITATLPPVPLHSSKISSRISNDAAIPSTTTAGVATKSDASRVSARPSPQISAMRSNAVVPRASIVSANGHLDEANAEFEAQQWELYKKGRVEPLLQWWKCYVEDGEVQMATLIYIIGKVVVDFPEVQCERIADAYVELLEAHRLPIVAAYIRRYAGIPSLEVRPGDEGMTHIVHCAHCRKSTGNLDVMPGEGQLWWCKNCRLAAKICVVCHQGVRGLWMGCNRCKHGGHQKCMRLYFLNAELRTASSDRSGLTEPKGSRSLRVSNSEVSVFPYQGQSYINSSGTNSSQFASNITTTSENTTDGSKSGSSGQDVRDMVIMEEEVEVEELRKGWSVCPEGCGCRCRSVVCSVTVQAVEEP